MFRNKANRSGEILGWQFNMVYLGGDPYNENDAAVILRVLEKALVIRSSGQEDHFVSIMIPYNSLRDVCITDSEGKRAGNLEAGILDKKAACSEVLVSYTDGGQEHVIHLCMSSAPDMKTNSEACKKLLEFVKYCRRLGKSN